MFVSSIRQPSGAVSEPGQMPCMMFPNGDCTDACLPVKAILRLLLDHEDALETFRAAEKRLAENHALEEAKKHAAREEAAKAAIDVVTRAYAQVRRRG